MANYKGRGKNPEIPMGISLPISGVPNYSPSDAAAFDAMTRATKGKTSNLFQESGFTESAYNTQSTGKERGVYDRKAYGILRKMYDTDSAKNKFKDIDFNRYLELLKPSLFEERVLSREGDQKMGDFFLDIYEGDFDQFKASASRGEFWETRKGE